MKSDVFVHAVDEEAGPRAYVRIGESIAKPPDPCAKVEYPGNPVYPGDPVLAALLTDDAFQVRLDALAQTAFDLGRRFERESLKEDSSHDSEE